VEYNEAYRIEPFKRWSTRRELRLLRGLLASRGGSRTLLDVPCGGGRLSDVLEPFTERLIEADIARGQLLYGIERRSPERPTIWMTASAFHLPLRDGAVDGAICCRLSHHLPTRDERERLVQELLRVARRFVIFTFFDHHSLKNLMRRARQPFNHKPPKLTMTRRRVAALARAQGAELVACPPLSRLASGHRFALLARG
jgi:SAM-dependent methyltransferase